MREDKTWVEIDGKALKNNFDFLRKIVYPAKIAPVVKANAYGHGIKNILSILNPETICVDSFREAKEGRACEFSGRIIVLGYCPPDWIEKTAENDCEQVVYDIDTIEKLNSAGESARQKSQNSFENRHRHHTPRCFFK